MELRNVFFVLVLMSGLACGQITSAELSKPSYEAGEDIVLTVEITNTGSSEKNFSLTCSFVPVNTTYGLFPLLEEFELGAGSSDTASFEMHVTSVMPAGEWLAKVRLIEGDVSEGAEIDAENISFQIGGTLSLIDLEVFACRSAGCRETEAIFYTGETVYLEYDSSVAGLDLSGVLVLPDDTNQSVSIPSSFSPTQTGTHILIVTASKAGYQTLEGELRFGVLEGEVEIPVTNISAEMNDTVPMGPEENITTGGAGGEEEEAPFDLTLILGLLGVLIIGILMGSVIGKSKSPKKKK